MSKPNPNGSEGVNDQYDAGLEPVDGGTAPEGTEEDAAAAALRMDMLGVTAGDEPLEAPRRTLLASQNTLLVMIVVAAAGALLAMRFLGMGPRSAIAEVVKLNYDLDKPSAVLSADHKVVLADLSASRVNSQVPAEQVQRNPFKMAGALSSTPAPVEAGDNGSAAAERAAREQAERERRERDQRQQKIVQTLATIQVNSVMTGAIPVVRLNGELYRIGDTVEDVFTIKDIHGRGVVLEADGKTYSLDMVEGIGGKSKGRPAPRK